MSVHDTLGDFLTTIRNASTARKKTCTVPLSKMHIGVLEILKKEGYILTYREKRENQSFPRLEIFLKYVEDTPAITGIERCSKPGRRLYHSTANIPHVLGGLGIAILTTSKGILKGQEARRQKSGGELLCKVW